MADDDLVEAPLLPDERRSALVIATAAYQHRAYNPLPGSARDLTSMAEMLGDPKVCGFQVQTLLNKPYAEVWLAINRFFNSRTRDELLLVYFSGHGIMDDHGRLHLATTDTDPDTLAATSIAARFMTDLSRESAAGRQVVILDCCHSGAYDAKGISPVDLLGTDRRHDADESTRGRCFILSARAGQYAFQRRSADGSEFTVALVDGVRTGKADAARNGRITVHDAYMYAHATLTATSRRQTPQLDMKDLEGKQILLARNPVGVRPGTKSIYELVDQMQSPYEPIRRGAVEALGGLIHSDNPVEAEGARRQLQGLVATDGPLAPLARRMLVRRIPPDPAGEPPGPAARSYGAASSFEPAPRRPSPRARPDRPVPRQPDSVEVPGEPETGDFEPAGESDDAFDSAEFPPPTLDADDIAFDLDSVADPLDVFNYRPVPEDEPSTLVARYLYPTEKFRGEWRRHWVDPFLAAGVSGLAAGRSLLPETAHQLHLPSHLWGVPTAEIVRWCLVGIAALAGLRVLSWSGWRISLSDRQVMVVRGVLWRRTFAIPLAQIANMSLTQSPFGRLLNYGTLSFHTGRWRSVRIRHIPNANELWLRFVEERFEPAAVEARLSRMRDEDFA